MVVVAVIGAQWGDEGKGKIVDFLAEKADVVVRFNGGDNAGHTVKFDSKTYKLHALPSGSVRKGKEVAIGAGCVVNPAVVLEELAALKKDGIAPKLTIDGRAHVIMPHHMALDALEETRKGPNAVGTTKRGVGPCYADKASRIGIRFADLADPAVFREKLKAFHEFKTKEIRCLYGGEISESADQVFEKYSEYAQKLDGAIGDASALANDAMNEGKLVLLEGAQGTFLSLDGGAYPYCTSSNATSGGASTGACIAPGRITEVVGIVKAYVSRVGEGPLPTELKDETGQGIRDKGGEYGTTTGRPRRIGWLDLVSLRQAHEINGFTGLAFTRIDTLAGIPKLKVCVAYELDGKTLSRPPVSSEELSRCKPVYEEMDGWKDYSAEEWEGMASRGFEGFPREVQDYLTKASRFLRVAVYMVSFGPSREETIILKNPFSR